MTIPPARPFDPFNPHPASAVSTLDCPGCRGIQPIYDDPVLGARCARCGAPVPVVFAGAPIDPAAGAPAAG